MRVSTDDDIYRARLVWLGPPGYTLPFQLPFAQYGTFVAVVAALLTAVVGLTGSGALAGIAIGASWFLTAWIWNHVDPDKPAHKVIKVALTDWRPLRAKRPGRVPRLSGRHIKFSPIPSIPRRAR